MKIIQKSLLVLPFFVVCFFALVNNVHAAGIPTDFDVLSVAKDQINISWNAPQDKTGLVGYKVYRNGNLVMTLGVDSTSYQDTGLFPEKVYSYFVASYDASGKEKSTVSVSDKTFHTADDKSRYYPPYQKVFYPQKIGFPLGGSGEWQMSIEDMWSNNPSNCQKDRADYNVPGSNGRSTDQYIIMGRLATYKQPSVGCVYNFSWHYAGFPYNSQYTIFRGNTIVRIYEPSSSTKFVNGDRISTIDKINVYMLPNQNSLIIGKENTSGTIIVRKASQFNNPVSGSEVVVGIEGKNDYDIVPYFVNGNTWWYVKFDDPNSSVEGWVKESDIKRAMSDIEVVGLVNDYTGTTVIPDIEFKIDNSVIKNILFSTYVGQHILQIPQIKGHRIASVYYCTYSKSEKPCLLNTSNFITRSGSERINDIYNVYGKITRIYVLYSQVFELNQTVKCVPRYIDCSGYKSVPSAINPNRISSGLTGTVVVGENAKYIQLDTEGNVWYYVKIGNGTYWINERELKSNSMSVSDFSKTDVGATKAVITVSASDRTAHNVTYYINPKTVMSLLISLDWSSSNADKYLSIPTSNCKNDNNISNNFPPYIDSESGKKFVNYFTPGALGCNYNISFSAINSNNGHEAHDSVSVSFVASTTVAIGSYYIVSDDFSSNITIDSKKSLSVDVDNNLDHSIVWIGKGAEKYYSKISSNNDEYCLDTTASWVINSSSGKISFKGFDSKYSGCNYIIQYFAQNGSVIKSDSISIELYSRGNANKDVVPPISPTNLRASISTENYVLLEWDESIDNVRVYMYNIYRDNKLVAKSYETSFEDSGPGPQRTVSGFYINGESAVVPASNVKRTYYVTAIDTSKNESLPSKSLLIEPITKTITSKETSIKPTNTQTTLDATTTVSNPIVTLTIDGIHDKTFTAGNTSYTYAWSSKNADTYSSAFTSNDSTKCGGGTFVANSASGSYTKASISTAMAGCVFTVTYTAKNSKTGKSASDTVVVRIQAPNTVNTKDTQAPSQPTGVTATTYSQNQVNLRWTASTDNVGVTTYKVSRNGVVVQSTSQTSVSDTGLIPGTSYTYVVYAYDAAGNASVPSASVSARTQDSTTNNNNTTNTTNTNTNSNPTPTRPTAPTNLSGTAVSSSQINLSWTASTDSAVTNYNIYRDDSNIAIIPGTTYTDTNLDPDTTYTYKVIAYKPTSLYSDSSNVISVKTQQNSAPSPTVSITIDGVHDKTFTVGNSPYTYSWSGSNADTYTSTVTPSPASCGSTGAWIANSASGSYSKDTISSGLAGCTFTVTYTGKDSKTGKTASDTVTVRIVSGQMNYNQDANNLFASVISALYSLLGLR